MSSDLHCWGQKQGLHGKNNVKYHFNCTYKFEKMTKIKVTRNYFLAQWGWG